jgi:sulfite reductase alpha subunit-like flavoprotein
MENNIKTFEKELNSIIEICDERIKKYKALLEDYQAIKGSALDLLSLNNNTKTKVVSLIDALKKIKYRLFSLMEKEKEYED